jgi:hypothetical protein
MHHRLAKRLQPSVKTRVSLPSVILLFLLGTAAWAQPPARDTIIAHGMTELDVLMIKDQIRQRWADYTLIIDGDGVTRSPIDGWTPNLLATNMRWLWFSSDGDLVRNLATMEEQRRRQAAFPSNVSAAANPTLLAASRHLPMIIKFDDITPTRVKTRTMLMIGGGGFQSDPKAAAAANSPVIPFISLAIYHDTWIKQDGRWVKADTTLYSFNNNWPNDPQP